MCMLALLSVMVSESVLTTVSRLKVDASASAAAGGVPAAIAGCTSSAAMPLLLLIRRPAAEADGMQRPSVPGGQRSNEASGRVGLSTACGPPLCSRDSPRRLHSQAGFGIMGEPRIRRKRTPCAARCPDSLWGQRPSYDGFALALASRWLPGKLEVARLAGQGRRRRRPAAALAAYPPPALPLKPLPLNRPLQVPRMFR